jgi:hypothetical protein
MPKYMVKSALKHDGKTYGIDDQVEMDAKQAAPLIASGVLAAPARPVAVTDPGDTKKPAKGQAD